MLRLVTAFYVNKKIKQQALYEQNKSQYSYGSEIRVRKEEVNKDNIKPEIKKEKAKVPTFIERLKNSDQKTKEYYKTIVDYCEKHNIKNTIYRHKVKFFVKNKTIANLYFTHKTLRLCVAVNPDSFEPEMLKFRDFSAYKKHKETPMSVLINSNKNVENCKILIFKALNYVS